MRQQTFPGTYTSNRIMMLRHRKTPVTLIKSANTLSFPEKHIFEKIQLHIKRFPVYHTIQAVSLWTASSRAGVVSA